jgi:hypothetical protein
MDSKIAAIGRAVTFGIGVWISHPHGNTQPAGPDPNPNWTVHVLTNGDPAVDCSWSADGQNDSWFGGPGINGTGRTTFTIGHVLHITNLECDTSDGIVPSSEIETQLYRDGQLVAEGRDTAEAELSGSWNS